MNCACVVFQNILQLKMSKVFSSKDTSTIILLTTLISILVILETFINI